MEIGISSCGKKYTNNILPYEDKMHGNYQCPIATTHGLV
jgi:hypothetical protein